MGERKLFSNSVSMKDEKKRIDYNAQKNDEPHEWTTKTFAHVLFYVPNIYRNLRQLSKEHTTTMYVVF